MKKVLLLLIFTGLLAGCLDNDNDSEPMLEDVSPVFSATTTYTIAHLSSIK